MMAIDLEDVDNLRTSLRNFWDKEFLQTVCFHKSQVERSVHELLIAQYCIAKLLASIRVNRIAAAQDLAKLLSFYSILNFNLLDLLMKIP